MQEKNNHWLFSKVGNMRESWGRNESNVTSYKQKVTKVAESKCEQKIPSNEQKATSNKQIMARKV